MVLATGCLWTALAAACGPRLEPARLLSRSQTAMGSIVTISVWTADHPGAEAAMRAAFTEFDRLEALLSVWKPGSDVLRINAAVGAAAVPIHRDVIELLGTARQVSEWSAGKFDVTFGPLAEIWRFDHDQDNRVPSPAEIAARLPLVDYRALHVDAVNGTARTARPGMRVHLGGIGKGFAVDRAVAILRRAGLPDVLVQAGGDLFASGRPGPTPWRLGIQDPRAAPGVSFATIELGDATLSTSGDYERFFIKDGRRYHHLLDPDTGEPARGTMSVSIVARSAVLADALSTGVFILGPEEGMALVERLPDVEAVIVTDDGDVRVSRGLQGRVRLAGARVGGASSDVGVRPAVREGPGPDVGVRPPV